MQEISHENSPLIFGTKYIMYREFYKEHKGKLINIDC